MKRAAKYAVPLAAVAAAGFDEPAEAGDLFLKLGDVKGESIGEGHEEEIDVLAWSWGLANSGSQHTGGGGGAGTPSFGDIKIIKSFDAASPDLLQAVAQGTVFPEATISVNHLDPQAGLLEYLKISLTNVLISQVAQGGKEGEAVTETIALNFAKVAFEYSRIDANGKTTGTVKSCWDIQKNEGC